MTSWLLWLNPTVNAILVRSVKRGGRLRQRQGFNRQGQAHIVSTATASPDPRCAPGAGVRLRTWFSIDPQPASINPTINISIVFICAFLVDCGRIVCRTAIKNDSGGNRNRANLPAVLTEGYHGLRCLAVKDWEIIATNLSKAGWSWGCVSAIDSDGQTIWIADAHRGRRKAFRCVRQ